MHRKFEIIKKKLKDIFNNYAIVLYLYFSINWHCDIELRKQDETGSEKAPRRALVI